MKFRGVVSEVAALRDFMNIGAGIAKLAKHCIVRITQNHLYFIVSEDDSGTTHPYIWCVLPVSYYFKEFEFGGVSEEYNEIYLEFNSEHFAQALNPLKTNGRLLKIKLANKQMPCLSFIVEQVADEAFVSRECVHDIPIDVISRKHWDDYHEPEFVDFHVSIHFPNIKSIKKIVDRMKNVSHSLTLMANKTGRLTLTVKSETVTISTHFSDLMIESFDVGSTVMQSVMDEANSDFISVTIDARKFLNFLNGMQMTNCHTKCSIVQSQMVKLEIIQESCASIECYLMEYNES